MSMCVLLVNKICSDIKLLSSLLNFLIVLQYLVLNPRSAKVPKTTPSGRGRANVAPPHKISAPIKARKTKIGG